MSDGQPNKIRAWIGRFFILSFLLVSWFYGLIVFTVGYELYFDLIHDGKIRLGIIIQSLIGLIPTSFSFLIGLIYRKRLPTWYWVLSLFPLPLLLLGGLLLDRSNP